MNYQIGGITFAPMTTPTLMHFPEKAFDYPERDTGGHEARLEWYKEDREIEELRKELTKAQEEIQDLTHENEDLKHRLRGTPWTH